MNTQSLYGGSPGPLIGIAMKEMVRRAIEAIRAQRFLFEAQEKQTPGKDKDFVTSADKAAQAIYVKLIRECFPTFGIVAEEDSLTVPCDDSVDLTFSVDPLDGTKAYMRRQSHGIGTMIALRHVNAIIGAYVGDVMTQEIFGFRPGSTKVHRISEYGRAEQLIVDPERPLATQYVLLRDPPRDHTPAVRQLVDAPCHGGLFTNMEVSGGSIGVMFARLWKGEVGGIVLRPGRANPWDEWPIIGISRMMGFVFLDGQFTDYSPPVSTATIDRRHEVLLIHRSRLGEFLRWKESTQ